MTTANVNNVLNTLQLCSLRKGADNSSANKNSFHRYGHKKVVTYWGVYVMFVEYESWFYFELNPLLQPVWATSLSVIAAFM